MRRSRKWNATLETGAARGGQTPAWLRGLSDLPRRAEFLGSVTSLDRRDTPSSKEGIKIHHYSDAAPRLLMGEGIHDCV
jgi:hypothetical protein